MKLDCIGVITVVKMKIKSTHNQQVAWNWNKLLKEAHEVFEKRFDLRRWRSVNDKESYASDGIFSKRNHILKGTKIRWTQLLNSEWFFNYYTNSTASRVLSGSIMEKISFRA